MSSLAALGVDAVYGAPLDGVPVVEVPNEVAFLYCSAHTRLTGRPVAVHVGDGNVTVPALAAGWASAAGGTWLEPGEEVLDRLRSATSPAVVAGPGVVAAGAVPGLHAFAMAGSLGVLNTWGAKGVFDWRSRHHLATVGLQAGDFELGGLSDADLVVAVGLDPREMVAEWRFAPVLEIDPRSLDPLAELWSRPRVDITVPPLRAGLAAATQAGWEVSTAPLPPTRVTRHYSQVLGAGGLVAGEPGPAGFWVARTFGTSGIGGAQVPSDPDAKGFAIACATVARLLQPGRPVLAVVDQIDARDEQLIATADRLGVSVPVEVWSATGDALDAAAHESRLRDLVRQGGVTTIATDPSWFERFQAVAGDIVAWT